MDIMLDLPPLKERISIAPVLLLVAAGHVITTSSPATLLKCDDIQPFSMPVPHDAGRKKLSQVVSANLGTAHTYRTY